jgi:outer membrane protein assembly factor BamB
VKTETNNKVFAIAFVLLLSASILMISAASVNAASYDTYLYITAAPNPVGINQQIQVTAIMPNVPPAQLPLDSPRYGYWENLSLKITKPDGTSETKGPYRTAEAGTGWAMYTPTTLGVYTFQWSFPGQTIETGASKGAYYKPSTSPVFSVTVQQQQIVPTPDQPIPTDYWQTPIYGENRAWSALAGNWLAGQNYRDAGVSGDGFNPYTQAPNSAHILWTKQEMFGGIASGETGSNSAYSGRRPSEKLTPPIIMSGRLYYNEPTFTGSYGAASYNGFSCIDLYTGEMLWTTSPREGQYITMGQVFYHYSTSQESVTLYLWNTDGSTWSMYDAWDGRWILNITGVQSGTNVFGPHGEILRYNLIGSNNTLTLWNSTKVLVTQIRAIGVAIDWTPVQGIYNYSDGKQWTTTVPDVAGSQSIRAVTPDLILASNFFPITNTSLNVIRQDMAYDIRYAPQVNQLWVANRTVFDSSDPILGYEKGIYVAFAREKLQWLGYNAYTGAQIWAAQPFDTAFSTYSGINPDKKVIANGILYNTGYDGMVRALNMSTGQLMWQWYTGSAGVDSPYGGWAIQGGYTGPRFADGKFFGINGEHTPMATPWVGGKVYAIDGTTGKTVWSISGTQAEAAASAIAYGKLVYLNGYDGTVYCFGKGKSEVTISASRATITQGTTALITGTVTDQSPAQKDTPAISDASMTSWMEYLHMQKQMPTNATGVPITVTAVGPDGNTYQIGTTTSDIGGSFGIEWTAPAEGKYNIMATFAGTESYGSSYATTYLSVSPAPAVTSPEPTATVQPTSEPTVTPTITTTPSAAPVTGNGVSTETLLIAGAAIVIVVAVIAAALVLRKRK